MGIEILGPVRHRCGRSNGCCEGHVVRVDAEEERRIQVFAPGLSVDQPVVGTEARTLRRVGGRCVFLDPDGCRIHAAYGADAKPAVCRQYPLVAVRVDDAVRVGIDTGCLTGWTSWKTGPKLDSPQMMVSTVPNEPEWLALEDAILDAAQTLPVPALIVKVTGHTTPVFADWVKDRARRGRLVERILHPDTAGSLRAVLAGIGLWIQAPVMELAPAADGYVREMLRRVVWLRLAQETPHPVVAARLVLAGAVLLSPLREMNRFGPAFAGWTRVIRAPEIARILID